MATSATRTLTALVVAACLLAVAMAVRPHWLTGQRAGAAGGEFYHIADPDERVVALNQRSRAKAKVVRQLVAGELTLLDAAAAFRFMNDRPANAKDESWRTLPGNSDGERLCQQVIRLVASHLEVERSPSDCQARVGELKRELADHLAQHGTVDLGPVD